MVYYWANFRYAKQIEVRLKIFIQIHDILL